MEIREAVRKLEVLQAASPATLAMLVPQAMLKRYLKGEHIFFDKDEVSQVFFVIEGSVSLYRLSKNDEKKVIFIYGAGAMLNEVILDGLPASINCEILGDSQIMYFDKGKFLFACEQDFGLAKAVIDSMALKIRRLYHQMKNTPNTVRGDKRIASKLWKLSRDHGVPCSRGTKISFDLTITFLADLLGSTRETVSRQLKLLTDAELVIYEKNRFIIPDREKLLRYFNAP